MADTLFSQETLKRGHFDELTRKFLYLPPEQNKKLCQNIETEEMFRPYEHNPKFSNIFRYKNQVSFSNH